jgi:biopolymer transport protein ExbB
MKVLNTLLLSLVLVLSQTVQAADIDNVKQQLINDIKQANARHNTAVENISQQRANLLKTLAIEEQKLEKLTTKAAAITRNKDEQTVSLEQLESRLSKWQQQLNYLNHLFDGLDPNTDMQSAAQLTDWLNTQASSYPVDAVKVAMPNGDYVDGQRISFGPLNWFVSKDAQYSGFIQYEISQWLVVYEFDQSVSQQLTHLVTQGSAIIPVDPSNNRNITLAKHQESIVDHIEKGGIWVFPILAAALVALTVALVKAFRLLRLPTLQPLLNIHQPMGRYQQQLVDITKQFSGMERDDKMLDALMTSKRQIERGLSAIAVIASVAPLLGLLGTVSGMIQTFKLMTLFGSGDANAVSGGISESLVTTELGLVVAIPALIAHALMSRKCQHYMSELESFAVHLSHLDSEQVSGASRGN